MMKYSSTAAKIKLFTAEWEVTEKKHNIQSYWQLWVMSHISATRQKHSLPSSLLTSLTTLSQVLKLQAVTDYELWFGMWGAHAAAYF